MQYCRFCTLSLYRRFCPLCKVRVAVSTRYKSISIGQLAAVLWRLDGADRPAAVL